MRKQIIFTTLLAALLLMAGPGPSFAADAVQVTLPSFPIELNGQVVDNQYSQYPLIVYKNITYFPMTYYDCRFLGLETTWNKQDGLKVSLSNLSGAYHQQKTTTKNSQTATARIADGKVSVNGKTIDNSKEDYPLLSFRNVAYFPLTWRFAVKEFGWQYHYDNQKGLQIDSANAKTNSVILTDGQKRYYPFPQDEFDFSIDNSYFYYQGTNGIIYSRPLSNLHNDALRKQIGQVPNEALAKFYEQSGKVFLRFRENTLSEDNLYRIENEGLSHNLLLHKNDVYVDFGDFQIDIPSSALGNAELCQMQVFINNSLKPIGDNLHHYALEPRGTLPYDQATNTLYVSMSSYDSYSAADSTSIASVDLFSGKITPLREINNLNNTSASDYDYDHNIIYYVGASYWDSEKNGYYAQLHALDLCTMKDSYISEIWSTTWSAAKNGVYYIDKNTEKLMFWNRYSGQIEVINSVGRPLFVENQNGYIIAQFSDLPENPYRLMIFAPAGTAMKQVYTTSDISDKCVINQNGLLVYRLHESENLTSQFVLVQLAKAS